MIHETEQMADFSAVKHFIRRNYKTLVYFSFAGALVALVLTSLLPKEYRSSAVLYPPSSTSIDNSVEFPNFGYDVEADRLIQILQSQEIRDSLIKQFELLKVFDIDPSEPDWLDKLTKKYFKNIKFERGISMSVNISARSTDPVLSAQMVNYIIHLLDAIREKIYKTNIISAYTNAERDYLEQKARLDSAESGLIVDLQKNHLSSLLMILPDAQIAVDFDKLSSTVLTGTDNTLGPKIIAFKELYGLMKEYKTRYIKIKKSYDNPIPKLFVINYAEPNYKKVFPSLGLNLLIAVCLSLTLAFVVLIIRQKNAKA
jgi:hypothetical protein